MATKLAALVFALAIILQYHNAQGGQAQESNSLASKSDLRELERQELRSLLPDLIAFRGLKGSTFGDDYHSNIELDRTNDANSYELVPSPAPSIQQAPLRVNHNLASLVERLYNLEKTGRTDRKRSIGQMMAAKDDKDYSFVTTGIPTWSPRVRQSGSSSSKDLANKLRDMILLEVQPFR